MGKLRWAASGVLLFLVVAIDFTSKMMSILAAGGLRCCFALAFD